MGSCGVFPYLVGDWVLPVAGGSAVWLWWLGCGGVGGSSSAVASPVCWSEVAEGEWISAVLEGHLVVDGSGEGVVPGLGDVDAGS